MLSVHNNHNMNFVSRNMAMNSHNQNQAMQKLASGFKINTASDDPAGLVMSEKLRSQIEGLEKALSNTNDSDNIMGIMDGALGQVQNVLTDLKKLAIGAANSGVVSQDIIAEYQAEMDCGLQAIDRIMGTTTYGGRQLLHNVLESNKLNGTPGNPVEGELNRGLIMDKDELAKLLAEAPNQDGNLPSLAEGEEMDPEARRALELEQAVSQLSERDQSLFQLGKKLQNLGSDLGSVKQVTGYDKKGEATYTSYNLQDMYSGGAASLERDPVLAMKILDESQAGVLATRAQIGATQAMRVHEKGAMSAELENLTKMESSLRDTDFSNSVQEMWQSGLLVETGMKMYEAIRKEQEGLTELLDTLA